MTSKNLDRAALNLLSQDFEESPIIAQDIVQRLQSNLFVSDPEFDLVFPPFYRFLSPVQWTSLNVTRAIAEWIRPHQNKKFVDVGSGVGKLCLALRFWIDLEIHGVEQRPHLVAISQEIAKVNELKNIHFSAQNLIEMNWSDFDIFYLYNPFQEHVSYTDHFLIDNKIELHQKYFQDYTARVYEELKKVKPGSMLITFHGYGGKIPKSWSLRCSQYIEGGFLSMWVKNEARF